ncbi:MAG: multiheme c-type cytochrome [Mangrovibacterium sp.]
MITSNKQRSYRLYLLVLIAVLIPLFVIKQLFFPVTTEIMGEPQYVGREVCVECHGTEEHDFMGSDHDLAMDVANDSTVLADFNHAELHRSNGEVNKAYKKNDKYYVLTDGEDGGMKEYEVKYVFGHYPLQNYLVEFPGGKLQVLPLTWSTRDSAWYYMADSIPQYAKVDHKDWLHWTNQAQNWNSMCAYCHTTGFKKNYDVETDTYHSTWTEGDVSCEACHGPASNHIKWANMPEYAQKDWDNYGLVTKTSGLDDNEQYVEMCARCHSRRATFGDQYPHNMATYDFMQMALPQEPQWYVDGQVHDEDYVVASFMQSKMFQRGVQCNDCHNVHSGERKLEGNALCFQCHNPADYDTYAHHHHKYAGEKGEAVTSLYGDKYDVGSGTECVNCHMPAQYYMGVDLRNDHSFRVPRPDLSDKLGSPNACVQCHGNETNQWAAKQIEQWHGKPYKKHWGETVFAAKQGEAGSDSALLRIIDSAPKVYPNIVRSTALATLDQEKHDDVFYRYLTDENDMLRNTAINTMFINNDEDAAHIFPLLSDARRAVRSAAAFKLLNYPKNRIPKKYLERFKSAVEDFGDIQKYNADFPLGRFNLGNYYVLKSSVSGSREDSLKYSAQADECFMKAYAQDTAMNQFALQLAYRFNTKGDLQKSSDYFAAYLKAVPNDAGANYDYGLLLSSIAGEKLKTEGEIPLARKKELYDDVLKHLKMAIKLDPLNMSFNYNNISQVYMYYGENDKAEQILQKAIGARGGTLVDYANLFNFYAITHNKPKAEAMAKTIVDKYPNDPNVQKLKGWKMP